MGTQYTVKITDLPQAQTTEAVRRGIEEVLERVNGAMSTYLPASELSRFNAKASTDWVDASAALVEVVGHAQRVSQRSDGAFDVTVGPLVNLWGFGPGKQRQAPPSAEEIAAVQRLTGYNKLQVRTTPPALRKVQPGIYVDLSAIAKGYGADRVAQFIESLGIAHYMVEVGGELRVRGHNGGGVPWRIAIEQPLPGERSVRRIVQPGNNGVATSGDYRNYFEHDGQRFSHTIDPRSGRPIDHALASVTVIDSAAMAADAWATALLVLGPVDGPVVAERDGLAAHFVIRGREGLADRYTRSFGRFLLN